MKAGDRLLCKCDSYRGGDRYLIENEHYVIREIGASGDFITIIDEFDEDIQFFLYFFFDFRNSPYIWNYFYTLKEERKIKIRKLNENW